MAIGTFDTRREAAHALGRFASNHDTRTVLDRKASRQTVGEFSESWWKTRTGHRPSTRVRDREALDRDVLPFFRDAQLGRLDRADVQEWIEHLSERLAPSTVRRTYVVLDPLLGVAVDRGIIAASPAKGVQLSRIVRTEGRFLTHRVCEQRPTTEAGHSQRSKTTLSGVSGFTLKPMEPRMVVTPNDNEYSADDVAHRNGSPRPAVARVPPTVAHGVVLTARDAGGGNIEVRLRTGRCRIHCSQPRLGNRSSVYIDGVPLRQDCLSGQTDYPFNENRVLRVGIARGATKDDDVASMN